MTDEQTDRSHCRHGWTKADCKICGHLPETEQGVRADGPNVLLRNVVDWTYLHATEGAQWPSTKTIDELIRKSLERGPSQIDADAYKAIAPLPSEGPVTTEQLDKLQFGKALHVRPAEGEDVWRGEASPCCELANEIAAAKSRVVRLPYVEPIEVVDLTMSVANRDLLTTALRGIPSEGAGAWRDAIAAQRKAIDKIIRKLLREGQFPEYHTEDDRGLEPEEYTDFVMAVLHQVDFLYASPPSASPSVREAELRMIEKCARLVEQTALRNLANIAREIRALSGEKQEGVQP